MSVYVSERGTSRAEFVNTARDIEVFLLKRKSECLNRKVLTFIGKHLIDHSVNVLDYVTVANRIRVEPGNHKNRDIRSKYLYKALDELDVLETQLTICVEVYGYDFLTPKLLKEIAGKLRSERNLIRGVIASDTARFSDPYEVLDKELGRGNKVFELNMV